MSRRANLTVAVATCDRPASLGRCLDALLAGTVLPAEIVVVDQGSDQAAARAVEARQSSGCALSHLRQERLGLSASRNAGWKRAEHPVLAVTDDDCVPEPHWVEVLDRTFQSKVAPGAVTGRVLPLGPPSPGTRAVSSRESLAPADYRSTTAPWRVGTGANFACSKAWLERLGGYDTRLGAGTGGGAGEDTDLLYRLLRAGARVRYEPDAVVYHERQPETRRLETRFSYGHGIGACCALWLRAGDAAARIALARWILFRTRRLCGAAAAGQWSRVREERIALKGTLAGWRYGKRA